MNDLLIFVPPGHDNITLAFCISGGYIPRPGDEILVELAVTHNTADPRTFSNAYFRVLSIMPCLKNIKRIEEWMTLVWPPDATNVFYVRVEGTNDTTRAYIERLIAEYESE